MSIAEGDQRPLFLRRSAHSAGIVSSSLGKPKRLGNASATILPHSMRPVVWLRPRAKAKSSGFCCLFPAALPVPCPCPASLFLTKERIHPPHKICRQCCPNAASVGPGNRLLLLKTFQRLGYFAACAEIPAPIIRHVFRCAALAELPERLQAYDASTARDRHTALIREFLGVTAYGPAAREVVVETCL